MSTEKNKLWSFLLSIGLEQYCDRFAAEDIDFELLCELSQDDLKELGLTLGHRKRLIRAIAELEPTSESRPPTNPPPTSGADEAERRQITVMFCDLVGSTALSNRLDPEDLRSLMRRYQERCRLCIVEARGFIARYMGDGILVYFGYPSADETDAERAVRAGLALREAVAGIEHPGVRLEVRVGIATGLVVVGDIIGEGISQERDVVGETPNLAARLQGLAGPGDVVIGSITRQLLGGLFTCEDLGPQSLKGFDDPISAWRVEAELVTDGRFAAQHGSESVRPMIGRDAELATLAAAWDEAMAGRGLSVTLSGEAGIGKSRLLEGFLEQLGGTPRFVLRFQCVPNGDSTAYLPFIRHFSRLIGLDDIQDPNEQLARLREVVQTHGSSDEQFLSRLASLLAIESGDTVAPEAFRQSLRQGLLDQVVALSNSRPVLVVFEDLHWADPTSVELLEDLIDRAPALRALMIITTRPEGVNRWADITRHIALSRLTGGASRAVVAQILEGMSVGSNGLPEAVLNQIVQRTDGVPLFLEELTKTVANNPSAHRGEAEGGREFVVPATLRDSLTARLDQLGWAREVAQVGAVVGRRFPRSLLADALNMSGSRLDDALQRLLDAEIVQPESDDMFVFRHALLQDAAYQSLLRSRRRELHERIASRLVDDYGQWMDAEPSVLAAHYDAAGMSQAAAKQWALAAERSSLRSAYREAIAQFARAIDALQPLPASPERDGAETNLQIAFGATLIAVEGYAAPRAAAAYARAHELCVALKNESLRAVVLRGQWASAILKADYDDALAIGRDLERSVPESPPSLDWAMAKAAVGIVPLYLGDYPRAIHELDRGWAHYQQAEWPKDKLYWGADPGMACLSYGGRALWFCGQWSEAFSRGERAIDMAGKLPRAFSYVQALGLQASLYKFHRDVERVGEYAEQTISLSEKYGIRYWRAHGEIMKGWVLAQTGARERGYGLFAQAVAECRAMGTRMGVPWFLGMEAEFLLSLDRPGDAARCLEEALALSHRTGETWSLPELLRLKGQTMVAAHPADAGKCFDTAMTIATEQGARAWMLRIATSIARYFPNEPAVQRLRDVLTTFDNEPLASPDLDAARAVLTEIPVAASPS